MLSVREISPLTRASVSSVWFHEILEVALSRNVGEYHNTTTKATRRDDSSLVFQWFSIDHKREKTKPVLSKTILSTKNALVQCTHRANSQLLEPYTCASSNIVWWTNKCCNGRTKTSLLYYTGWPRRHLHLLAGLQNYSTIVEPASDFCFSQTSFAKFGLRQDTSLAGCMLSGFYSIWVAARNYDHRVTNLALIHNNNNSHDIDNFNKVTHR